MLARRPGDLAAFRDRPKRVLAVFPHPDDESYGPAGTLLRTARQAEGSAAIFIMTRGEASRIGPATGRTPDEVARLREKRLLEVASILELDGLILGDFPDSKMARCSLEAMAGAIGELLDAYEPQVVIGHDPRGVNAHPDHIATHWALRRALEPRPIRFAMLAYPAELAEAIKPRLLFPTPEREIDAVLELDKREIEAKEKCLRIHDALVTLKEEGDETLLYRPPIERYDFLDEDHHPPLNDLFERCETSSPSPPSSS